MMTVVETYASEQAAARLLRQGGRVVLPSGARVDLGPARPPAFNPLSLPLMQGLVNGLYSSAGGQGEPPTLVLSRRAHRRAWYSPRDHRVILPVVAWSLDSELVLLHEVAHAVHGGGFMDQREAHGEPWRRTYCGLVHRVRGPGAALMLEESLGLQRV